MVVIKGKLLQAYYDHIQLLIADLFCGAGGDTIGFEDADHTPDHVTRFLASIESQMTSAIFKAAKVVAAINHDPLAIKSHWENHYEIEHFQEDIRTLDPFARLKRLFEIYRAFYPHAKIGVWASLECTNFSKAKGGDTRDEDSRTLAFELYHYIEALDPDYIFIENVVEFMAWGPMSPKIIKSPEGYESCVLKIVTKNGITKVKPGLVPDSKNNGKTWLQWRNHVCDYGYHDEWKKINCADLGAIQSRERLFGCFAKNGLPIVWPEATHAKNPEKASIGKKLEKWQPVKQALDFDDEGKSIFNRTLKNGTPDPLSPNTMQRVYMGAIKHIAGGQAHFLTKFYSGKPHQKHASVDNPSPSITTFGGGGLVKSIFLYKANRLGKVHFISKYNTNDGKNSHNSDSIEGPCGCVMTKDSHSLIAADKFIMPTSFDNHGSSIEDPSPAILASRRHHYIVNPSWFGNYGSIEDPCYVVVARQDKAPLYLITCETGNVAVPVYDGDCEYTIKLKEFMALYNIVDIKMRMLKVDELKVIQGFPEDYILCGNTTDQKKFIGNAVHKIVPKKWSETLTRKLITHGNRSQHFSIPAQA